MTSGRQFFSESEGLLAAVGDFYVQSLAREGALDQIPRYRVVVNYQHRARSGRPES